ncbi:MAG: hypothetical protein JWR36_689 [Glaciihabitans sp.]|jgi:hypothetical protein|nr:hypothetical protein [Glaciihabitans sp.]MDQ1572206.1 hypothetical protein [Actinomycetota bacterium]
MIEDGRAIVYAGVMAKKQSDDETQPSGPNDTPELEDELRSIRAIGEGAHGEPTEATK